METLTAPKRDKAKIKPDLTKPHTIGHNSGRPDRETLLIFAGRLADARAKTAAARKEEGAIRKMMINAGVVMKVYNLVEECLDEGPEAIFARLSDFQYYAQAFSLPIGTQMSLFENPTDAPGNSHEEQLKKAEENGYQRGLLGASPDDQAYQPNTDLGQAHMNGWHKGQKVLLDRFTEINERTKTEEEAKADEKAKKQQEKADKAAAAEAKAKEKADAKAARDKKKAEDAEWKKANPKKRGRPAGKKKGDVVAFPKAN